MFQFFLYAKLSVVYRVWFCSCCTHMHFHFHFIVPTGALNIKRNFNTIVLVSTICLCFSRTNKVKMKVMHGVNMDEHAQTWTNTHKHGRTCTNMDEHAQTWTNMHKHGRTCTNMDEHARTWTNMHKHGRTCTNMEKHAQTWTNTTLV
jgi:hypothetical protein